MSCDQAIAYTRYTEDGKTQLVIHQGDTNAVVRKWNTGNLSLGADTAESLPPVEPAITRTYTFSCIDFGKSGLTLLAQNKTTQMQFDAYRMAA
jgi:hypothetical protein